MHLQPFGIMIVRNKNIVFLWNNNVVPLKGIAMELRKSYIRPSSNFFSYSDLILSCMTPCLVYSTYPVFQTSFELELHWHPPWHASHLALRHSWKAIWMTSRVGDLKIVTTVKLCPLSSLFKARLPKWRILKWHFHSFSSSRSLWNFILILRQFIYKC